MSRRAVTVFLLLLIAVLIGVGLWLRRPGRPIPIPSHLRHPAALARPFGAAVSIPAARADSTYLRDYLETFTSMTPENAMKWDAVQPDRDSWEFGEADALVTLARKTGKRVRGHTLVWGTQLPAWVAGGHWTPAQLRAVLVDHVRTEVAHFRGKVESWDVVNEPLANDGRLAGDVFLRVLGPSYIDLAFRTAHAADPHARLFLNELAGELPGPKQDALVALVAGLRRRGVPIDGVGLEDHTESTHYPRPAQLLTILRRLTSLGLDVEITELDVALRGPPRLALEHQAEAYAATARACAAVPRCTGLTVWGVTDRWSWLGAQAQADLFDARGRPKPALAALRRAFGRG